MKQVFFIVTIVFLSYSTHISAQKSIQAAVELVQETVKLDYPQPVKLGDQLQLTIKDLTNVQLTVTTLEGKFIKLLLNQELMAGQHKIPVVISDIPNGDYLLEVKTNEKMTTRPFQVNYQPPVINSIEQTISSSRQSLGLDNQIVRPGVKLEFPNPLSSGKNIILQIDKMTDIELTIVTKEDNKFIKLLMHQELMPGQHEVPVVVSDIPSGSYLLQLDLDEESITRNLAIKHN